MSRRRRSIHRRIVSFCNRYVVEVRYYKAHGNVGLTCRDITNDELFCAVFPLALFRHPIEERIAEAIREKEDLAEGLYTVTAKRTGDVREEAFLSLKELSLFLDEIDKHTNHRWCAQ